MTTKSRYAVLFLASLLFVFLFCGTASASTWTYSDPSFMMADPDNPEWTIMTCGHVPYSTTQDTLGIFLSINVTDIDYYPLPLPIETFTIVNYTAPNGSVTQYDLRETNWYWYTGMHPIDLESTIHYQVGTYDIVDGVGVGQCQLIVDPAIVPVHVERTEYGDGWQKEYYSDGKVAYSNHPTYLRWDNVWIPAEWLNISNGNWSYTVQDNPSNMSFTADGKTISIPKANTKFDLSLFKISPSLTYSKTALQNNMVNVNATVAYLTFPYFLSQIKDYADEHNIKVGRWMFHAGQEHIGIYDDVPINHTFVNMTGQNETYLAVTTLDKSAYTFRIMNDEIRLYFLKSEANKMSGNITFELKSWVVGGEGGNAWSGNSSYSNFALDRNTNHIILPNTITDGLVLYHKMSGSSGTTSYDMNLTTSCNGVFDGDVSWTTNGKYGNGLYFDGVDDMVQLCGSGSALDITTSITLEAWVKPESISGYPVILGMWTDTSKQYKLSASLNGNGLSYIDVSGTGTNDIYRQAATAIDTTRYYYITGVYNSSAQTLTMYIDGNLSQGTLTGTVPSQMFNSTTFLALGNQNNYVNDYNGDMDEVRIYNRVLTNDEINQTMINTMLTSDNLTTWHDAGTGNETYQVTINATTPTNSNYTVNAYNNDTSALLQTWTAQTGNQTLTFTGTKAQDTKLNVTLNGNSTATPELITVTFWTQTAGGGTLYERAAADTVTVTDGASRTFYAIRTGADAISVSDTTKILQYDFTPPNIDFIPPTDDNNSVVTRNYTFINTSVSDEYSSNNLTALINFDNSLVSWWRFNNNTGTVAEDHSGYNNNGTLTNMNIGLDNGTSGWNSSGKFGNAISFDGTNDYVIGVGEALPSAVTVEAWVKHSGTVPTQTTGLIYIYNSVFDCFIDATGRIKVYLTNNVTWHLGNMSSVYSDWNTWHHVVVTYANSSGLKIYRDGVLITNDTDESGNLPGNSNFWIGRNSAGSYAKSIIDDVRIYNRALSPEEINASYNAGTYRLYHNFTSLSDGTHNYTAYVQDLAGNVNNTEKRYITINAIPDIYVRLVSDAMTVTEYASATFTDVGEMFTRYASDAVTVADGAIRQLTYNRLTSDSIAVTEGAQRLLSAFRAASTSITITDSASRTAIYNRAVQQAIAVAENVQSSLIEAGALYIRYASDTITVLEGAAVTWWEGVIYTVSGYVFNILSSPLEDARVEYVGGNYSFSDASGHYAINVPAGDDREILSRAIGYKNDSEIIDVSGNVQQNFTLSERRPVAVSAPGFRAISGLFILAVTIIFIRIRTK